MAYVSKELKAKAVAQCKKVLAKYGVKATFSVSNHSTLNMNIKSAPFDFGPDMDAYGYLSIHQYNLERRYHGDLLAFLQEAFAALKTEDFFDHSDLMTDYFHCSHYVNINVGSYDKPFKKI